MKVNNKTLKSFEDKLNGIVEFRSRVSSAITRTENEIEATRATILDKSREIAQLDVDAILSGEPPTANGEGLIQIQNVLMVLEARATGLHAKRGEIRASLEQLKSELEEARRVWAQGLISEHLRKSAPAIAAFMAVMRGTVPLEMVLQSAASTCWFGLETSLGSLKEFARIANVPFPEQLVFTEDPMELPDVQETIASLASPDQLAARIERELREYSRPAAPTLEAVA